MRYEMLRQQTNLASAIPLSYTRSCQTLGVDLENPILPYLIGENGS